ncbi:DUF975 family protein [Paenibacillus gansuensis]|uniref:DUF975 family protein n=1 Tax=Paenibacillus gansuensis TaxID=306542 RepID=A0ABW5PK90_9BACL
MSVIGFIPVAGNILPYIIGGPLALGIAYFFLKLIRGEETAIEDMFAGFRKFVPAFVLYLLTAIFTLLWLLLLIVPGIIAGLRYSQAFYIMVDCPELKASEALNRSKEMMAGNKWKLFCFYWGFFGWLLLCILTLGIGLLWLYPYYETSRANFYQNLRDQHFTYTEPTLDSNPPVSM